MSILTIRKNKEQFLAESKGELSELQYSGLSHGIDCLIENEASGQDLPIIVVGYDDHDRNQVLDFLIKFFRKNNPGASDEVLISEPLMISGSGESDALFSLISIMRSRGRLLFYWADSASWFRHLPSGLFHVVEIERNGARRGLNQQGSATLQYTNKVFGDSMTDLSREMFGVVNFGEKVSSLNDFDAHRLFYEEVSSKIIRPIPAPLTMHFDELITIKSPLWQKQACVALRRYQAKECNDSFGWDESDEGWENTVVHPFLSDLQLSDGDGIRECLIGQVTMICSPDDNYCLSTVWLHPFYRRQGKLKALWPELKEKYGNFDVEQPNDSMKAFMASVS